MTMTATQFNRNCVNFINALEKSDSYEGVKHLLSEWKDNNKPAVGAIDTFIKISQILKEDEQIVQEFNKCLAKEASILKKPSTNLQVKQMAMQNSNSGLVLDTVLNWLKNDQRQKVPPAVIAPLPISIQNPQKIQQLTEQELVSRLQIHHFAKDISKAVHLYRRCIITLKQFKSLIEPIYLTDPSAFNMLFQYAEQLEEGRRKITIFAPLTDLVDQKYPVEQVGNSYIIIPDGYSNYSRTWTKDPMVKELNRICCSVPLGSEGSFVISRKNEFQEQLFKNQEEKYEIDHNICLIKGAISSIQSNKNLNTPLLQKLLTKMYPQQNVYNIMIGQQSVAKDIILPRLYQKQSELVRCKGKFEKQCEQVANKNYFKSLDYRCFYFRKNDKKFNSTQRWQKEIELRKKQIAEGVEEYEDQITDRQALQCTRKHVLNSFDNITKQSLLPDKIVDLSIFDKKQESYYPAYPDNQILFILDFYEQDVFNDVLEIVLFHCPKKSLLELIILRLFKKIIRKRLTKDSSILNYIDAKAINVNGNQNNENSNHLANSNSNEEPLNEAKKEKKLYKDITQQFHDLIEEIIEPLPIQEMENPFEGPNQHTFVATKPIYNFVRYLLAIYQRFLKAKQMSDEKLGAQKESECSIYSQFLTIMIFKIKDPKLFEEYLRKISTHEAFIFFTLDKFITSLTKLINNISVDSLTYKILKDGTKDYENDLNKWADFVFPTVTEQLTRVYREEEQLFRFTYSSTYMMYISAWQNASTDSKQPQEKIKKDNQAIKNTYLNYLSQPELKSKPQKNSPVSNNKSQEGGMRCLRVQNDEYEFSTDKIMIMKGQYAQCLSKRGKREATTSRTKQLLRQFDRVKKMIKRV